MPKIEPAVRQLLYLVPNGTSYIDLAKDLSIVNRRLYRQGMSYVVQDIQLGIGAGMKSSDVLTMTFSTVGNSWIVHNSWRKGFAAWRKQQREALEALPGINGKWADFKVYLDDTHEDGTTLDPYAADAAVYQPGEWEHSKLVFDDDGTEREFKMHMIGSSNLADTNNESAIGLIEEYANSRATVAGIGTPDVEPEASDTIYAKLLGTDEMSDMIIDNIEGDNDLPPYDQDDYPGGAANADAAVLSRLLSCSATQTTSVAPGFVAECGLVKVVSEELSLDDATSANGVYAAGSAPTSVLLLTVAAGPYRGVLAAPMGQ